MMPILHDLLDAFGGSNTDILLSAMEQLGEGVIVADGEGQLVFVNSAAAAIHGVKQLDIGPEDYTEAYSLLTPDGDPYPFEELPLFRAVRHGETVTDAHWKVARPDGKMVDAVGSARPVRTDAGVQVASVLTVSDMTAEFAAQRALDEALAAKETLLYEVNHRVKNNLALVSGLLRLQGRSVEDDAARAAFRDLSARIATLGDIHRRLYETGVHNAIDVPSFLQEMATATADAFRGQRPLTVDVTAHGGASMHIDRAVPLVLAINELVLNSVKHAFADTPAPRIDLEITPTAQQVLDIVYRDNGCGLPEGASSAPPRGIGQALIGNLSGQLGGSMRTVTGQEGFCVVLSIPLDVSDPNAPADNDGPA